MGDYNMGKARKNTPDNLLQGTFPESYTKSYMGRFVALAKASTAVNPGSDYKRLEVLLAAMDFCLFFMVALCIAGLTDILKAHGVFHRDALVLLDFSLFSILAVSCRYFDLADGRYSLGKALLITTSLWSINCLVFLFTSAVSVPLLFISAVLYTGVGIVSGYLHYKISFPHTVKNLSSPYYFVEQLIKRWFDVTACLLGLILISPLMLVVSLLVALDSQGEILFGQVRIGKNGNVFKMWKFRSMTQDAAAHAPVQKQTLYKKKDDPRVTRIGKILRKLSIDELPQLWNVICGEMSLVGPRPPLVPEYEQMTWYHRRKFDVLPGITGFWQITGRVKNHRNFNSVAIYDVHYIETWCLMEDLKILLKTIPVVLLQKGAC